MPTLPNTPAKSIPGLEDRDRDAMLKQDVCAPQPSEPSPDNTDADLSRLGHCRSEHVPRAVWALHEVGPVVEVLFDAGLATSGGGVRGVRVSFHDGGTDDPSHP